MLQFSLFSQVLSGCDFLTPFNHSKKPNCRFCGCKKINWIHILFQCTGLKSGESFFRDFKESVGQLISDVPQCGSLLKLLDNFWEQKKLVSIFQIMLGIGLENHSMNYLPVLEALVQSAAKKLRSVRKAWNEHEKK